MIDSERAPACATPDTALLRYLDAVQGLYPGGLPHGKTGRATDCAVAIVVDSLEQVGSAELLAAIVEKGLGLSPERVEIIELRRLSSTLEERLGSARPRLALVLRSGEP